MTMPMIMMMAVKRMISSFQPKKSFPPIQIMPMLASLSNLNDAPTHRCRGADAQRWEVAEPKGLRLPAQLHTQPQENRPPIKTVPMPVFLKRSGQEESRCRILMITYGMRRLPTPGGGRPTSAGGQTNGHYCGFLTSPHL
jgi:hypothetical protein